MLELEIDEKNGKFKFFPLIIYRIYSFTLAPKRDCKNKHMAHLLTPNHIHLDFFAFILFFLRLVIVKGEGEHKKKNDKRQRKVRGNLIDFHFGVL
jgi:hypothetical protein